MIETARNEAWERECVQKKSHSNSAINSVNTNTWTQCVCLTLFCVLTKGILKLDFIVFNYNITDSYISTDPPVQKSKSTSPSPRIIHKIESRRLLASPSSCPLFTPFSHNLLTGALLCLTVSPGCGLASPSDSLTCHFLHKAVRTDCNIDLDICGETFTSHASFNFINKMHSLQFG